MSGAMAVPSLGYVSRSGSQTDGLLFEATEKMIAKHWAGGRVVALPLPPSGFQWDLPNVPPGSEEEAEKSVQVNTWLDEDGVWNFSVAGVRVDAFDARKVISPCLLCSIQEITSRLI